MVGWFPFRERRMKEVVTFVARLAFLGKGVVRGHEQDLPVLRDLRRSLGTTGGEIVEVLAFPVGAKEEKR
jgi:hypothetical protein